MPYVDVPIFSSQCASREAYFRAIQCSHVKIHPILSDVIPEFVLLPDDILGGFRRVAEKTMGYLHVPCLGKIHRSNQLVLVLRA